MDTMAAILNRDPPDLSNYCSELPQSAGDIVRRCLEKRPEARFQSGRDLAFALRSTLQDRVEAAGRTGPDEKSIVVLPFENLSPDPDQEFFADGLTEEVISDLAKVRAIRVISRTSAMKLKGTDKDLRTIGRELNVRYVLEGSVRRAGDALKITAQLIDVITDTHVWADKYAGILEDVFEIQEKVSRAIVQALEIRLTPQEDRKIAERPTEDVKAYECYLRARSEMLRGPEECLKRALRMLEVGLDTFGGNVLLFTGIAEVYLQYYEYGIDTDDKILRNADRFARKVSELSPDSAEGHYLAGRIERFRGTALNAVRCFEQAFRANPDNIQNMLFLGHTYSHQLGQQRMAKPFMRRLAEIDPLTPLSLFALTMHRMITGDLDGAFDSCQKIFRLEPENWFSRLWAVYILLWQGKIDQALRLIEEVLQGRAENHAIQWCKFLELVLRGEKNEALGKLPEDTRLFFWNDPETPYLGADVFALMDERDKALDWIEHAINRGWINYPLFAHDDPLLENVRGERRFHDLMDRIKPEWTAFEAGIDLHSLPWAGDS
jgi:TolB-like protein